MNIVRDFYKRDTVDVARDLLGKKIVRLAGNIQIAGLITETEAYRSDDPACHGFRGKTERNATLFGPVGLSYIYVCYGLHYCFNIVSRDTKSYPGGGVLIRALVPLEGHGLIREYWSRSSATIIKGPGNVTKALGITKEDMNRDVTSTDSSIQVVAGVTIDQKDILVTPRIGISVAQEKLWRFVIADAHCKDLAALHSLDSSDL